MDQVTQPSSVIPFSDFPTREEAITSYIEECHKFSPSESLIIDDDDGELHAIIINNSESDFIVKSFSFV